MLARETANQLLLTVLVGIKPVKTSKITFNTGNINIKFPFNLVNKPILIKIIKIDIIVSSILY